jgi:hypothetical protein
MARRIRLADVGLDFDNPAGGAALRRIVHQQLAHERARDS